VLRFYGRLLLQTPRLLWDSARLWVEIAGVYTVTVGIIGVGMWSFPPAWALVPIGLFFVYGLLKANYLKHVKVREERDQLQGRQETEAKRAAVSAGLLRLYDRGAELRMEVMNSTDESPPSVWQDRLRSWRVDALDYLEDNVSAGKAQYVDAVMSVRAAAISGMKSETTRHEKTICVLHLNERLKRLAEVMREY